ncbi:MAG: metal ABC transporter ATP-binding protein [Nitrososphaerota archaeon]|jgi:ABC-type Mn2+/Zn2+ transport system ATPase subunit|nr:metal ABC transporter ATP-binding protein [Nitrososphaerota archaeon]
MNPPNPILKVTNLTVKLQNQTLLNNLTFNVNKGTTLAILGPNGAGKTVLFRALLNLLPHTGTIEWLEKTKIGYVPQYVTIADTPITVYEFLTLGNKTHNIKDTLNTVKLTQPDIENKRLGVLSGGQLRRVLIAWALTNNPNVLLLDEPTTGVDMDSEEPIYMLLNDIKKKQKITILLITHNIHIVQEYTDYLLAINKHITYYGPATDIANPLIQQQIHGEPVCVESLRGKP